jgi:hypothetical protein
LFANYNFSVKDFSKPDDLPSDVVEGATLQGNEWLLYYLVSGAAIVSVSFTRASPLGTSNDRS